MKHFILVASPWWSAWEAFGLGALLLAGLLWGMLRRRIHRKLEATVAARSAELQRLSHSEALFRLTFENANVGMCLLTLEGRFTRVNRQLCSIFGYSAEELLQLHINDLTHLAYRDISPLFVQHLRADKTQHTAFEQQFYRQDGRLFWGLASSTLVREAQGTPLYYVAYVQDVTDHKRAELALRDSEERFAAVLNSLQAAIYVADMETHELLFVNHHVCRTFGAIEGQRCWEVLQVDQDGPCAFCTNPQLLTPSGEATGPFVWEYQNPRTGRWYHLHDEAIHWIDGRWVRLEVATDITELKKADQRLLTQQRQLATLEERERIGRELHDDLGQVLSAIAVQAQAAQSLLAQDKIPQAESVLMQLTQVAQGAHSDVRQYILGIRPDAAETPAQAPAAFLETLQHYLHDLAHNYGFLVELDLPKEELARTLTPAVETQLLRIIQEALTNARKHAGVPQARLSFDLDAREMQVVVEDKGRGFDPDLRRNAPPAAGRSATDAPHFGLEIMAERAAKVGGSAHIHSQPGQGARVVVRMPRALTPAPLVQGTDSYLGLRVLLADDHSLFLEGLRTLLAAHGVQVVGVARNGQEAQAQARELRPDLILMDVNMPICDGIEATQRIKAEQPDIKIVMLTMADDDDTLFAALKAGASGYLLKNLHGSDFYRLLQELAHGEAVLAPGLAQRVLNTFTQREAAPLTEAQPPIPELNAQQLTILDLVAQGLTYKEIGARLHLSERTIRYHIGQILERLQLENRRAAVTYARRRGLGLHE